MLPFLRVRHLQWERNARKAEDQESIAHAALTPELSGRCRVPHDSASARSSGPLERIVRGHQCSWRSMRSILREAPPDATHGLLRSRRALISGSEAGCSFTIMLVFNGVALPQELVKL